MSEQGRYRRNVGDLHGHENISDAASPDTVAIRNMPRWGVVNGAASPFTSGTLLVMKFTLGVGIKITNANFAIAGTAFGTPTNQWAALYTPDVVPNGLTARSLYGAQGPDGTTAAGGTNTIKTLAVSTAAVTIPFSGDWYLALLLAGTTMPVVYSTLVAPPIATGEAAVCWTANTGLTTTAPATLGALTAVTNVPYVELT